MRLVSSPPNTQQGFTLVELMIAVTVSLLLMVGLVATYSSSSRASHEVDRAFRQIEAGRYTMKLLADDVSHAGFFGVFNPVTSALPVPDQLPDICATDVATLQNSMSISLQGLNDSAGLGCLEDVKAGSDVVVVRRVATCIFTDPDCNNVAGALYFQASGCNDKLELGSSDPLRHFKLSSLASERTLTKKDCATVADSRRYFVNIYYLANNDQPGDGIPTLKRAALGAGGAFSVEPIASGIEAMHLEYGLDLDNDGAAEFFDPEPGSYNACQNVDPDEDTACVNNWRSAVAVNVHLLVRSESQTPGHRDEKTYVLGLNRNGAENQVGPFLDKYKRRVYSSSMRVTNMAIRR